MPNQEVPVLGADGTTEFILNALGLDRQAATASKSVALSNEDKTQLDALVTALQLIDDLVGHKATTSLAGTTLASDAAVVRSYAGLDGVQIIRPHCNLEDIITGNISNSDGTPTEVIAAQAAGIKVYLTSIIITNTADTMARVEIKDGSTTKITLPVPAESGCIFNPPVPLDGTAATAWNFDAAAATSTLFYSAVGFTSKV